MARSKKTPQKTAAPSKHDTSPDGPPPSAATPRSKKKTAALSKPDTSTDSAPSSPAAPRSKKTPLKMAASADYETPIQQAARTTAPSAFTPSVMNKMGGATYQQELAEVLSFSAAAKRNFSQVSKASDDAIGEARSSKRFPDAATTDSFVTDQVRKKMDAMTEVIKTELDAAEGHVRVLNALYQKGDIGITTDEFRKNLETMETKVVLCQVNLAVLQGQKNQFIGEYVDDMETRFNSRRVDDAAYIDLLISRYRTPDNAKLTIFKSRDAAAQERFRKDVFSAYEANFEKNSWCCISGKTYKSGEVVAAHVVPYNVGEVNAEYLFGKSGPSMKNGHIISARNGIPMMKTYEEMFDDGRMTLVPVPGTTKIRVVVFGALDPDPSDAEKELHGKELSFKNDFRPANRYLYYHYAVTLLRRQRHAVPGWWRAFALYGRHTIWATPGQYLRQSSMLTLARNIGHLPPEEANFFVSPQGLPESDEDAPEFDDPDDARKDLLIAAAINMRPGPSNLRNPFIRERRGAGQVWSLDSRHISKEFEDMVVDDEDGDGSEDEGEDEGEDGDEHKDEDDDEDEGEDCEE